VLFAQSFQQYLELRIATQRLKERIAREPRVTRESDADGFVQPAQRLRSVADLRIRGAQTVSDVMVDCGFPHDALDDSRRFLLVAACRKNARQGGGRASVSRFASAEPMEKTLPFGASAGVEESETEVVVADVGALRDFLQRLNGVDARAAADFKSGSLRGAHNIPLSDVLAAKDDGRLPMEDHNTRLIVIGKDGEQARAVAASIASNAFANVTFFDGKIDDVVELTLTPRERPSRP
jgi:rhodanese-related sulfurtransferase